MLVSLAAYSRGCAFSASTLGSRKHLHHLQITAVSSLSSNIQVNFVAVAPVVGDDVVRVVMNPALSSDSVEVITNAAALLECQALAVRLARRLSANEQIRGRKLGTNSVGVPNYVEPVNARS